MPWLPFDDDDGRFERAAPPELGEATERAMARQQKLDDANFIIERTLQFQNAMAAEFGRAKRDGEAADPMFVKDLMKFASDARTEHLSDIPRGRMAGSSARTPSISPGPIWMAPWSGSRPPLCTA